MNLGKWILVVLGWCIASCALAWAEPGWDNNGVARKAAALLKKDDYAGLEGLVAEIKGRGYSIRQVEPELPNFYRALVPENKETDRVWLDGQVKLDGWLRAFPDSVTARVAQAHWYVGYGWRARGTGFAYTVTPEGWKLLRESLAKAAEILQAVPPDKIDDPEYYRIWMTVARGQGLDRAENDRLLRKGLRITKEFFPLYSAEILYLLPRWHGKQEDCARFAEQAAALSPGEDGEALYALLVREESWWYNDDYFNSSPANYERVRKAFLAEAARKDRLSVKMQNDLCYLAAIKGDKETAKALFLELGDAVDARPFGTQTEFLRFRAESGADAEISKAISLERSGNLPEAEKLWNSFHADPATNSWLLHFYQRQGKEAQLRQVNLSSDGAPVVQILDADVATASPDILANLARFGPQVGSWEKAEAAASAFDRKRPWNVTGKNTLMLCALHRGDTERAEAVRREFVALKTDRAAYKVAQSVLRGEKSWEEVRDHLAEIPPPQKKEQVKTWDQMQSPFRNDNAYLCQATTAIALYYDAKGDPKTAQTVIEEMLPYCPENNEKTLLESLLFGSLARSLNHPIPKEVTAASSPDAF